MNYAVIEWLLDKAKRELCESKLNEESFAFATKNQLRAVDPFGTRARAAHERTTRLNIVVQELERDLSVALGVTERKSCPKPNTL